MQKIIELKHITKSFDGGVSCRRDETRQDYWQ